MNQFFSSQCAHSVIYVRKADFPLKKTNFAMLPVNGRFSTGRCSCIRSERFPSVLVCLIILDQMNLLSRLFHFLSVPLLLPLKITTSSVAAELSCCYIKQNTHTETDVLFLAHHTTFFFFLPLLFIPPIQPARIQEKTEIMRNWDGYLEPPLLPLPSSSSSPSLCALRRVSYILFASRLIST